MRWNGAERGRAQLAPILTLRFTLMRTLPAARCIQHSWLCAKARQALVRQALPVLQAALRRQLATPTIKLGARVRLTADALDEPIDYDWSRDALPPDTYGAIVSFSFSSYTKRRYALVESDDARCPNTEYWLADLEPIIDGDPMSARAHEHARHARRHAAAARIQTLQRGRVVRQQHCSAPAFIFK